MALYDTKQYQAAANMLEKALNGNEDSESLNARLALCYQNLDDSDKALRFFKQTFLINPKLTNLRFDYANLLGNLGRNDEAIEQYKQYLAAFPEDANAQQCGEGTCGCGSQCSSNSGNCRTDSGSSG